MNVPYGVSELGAPGGYYTAVLERGMKENDAAQRQARQRTPPARRAGAVRRLRREAARTDETTESGTGDDGVMYWGKAAAGCDFTILFVCFRVRVGRRVDSPPRTFSKRTKCVVCLRPKLVTASCALYLIHNT